MAIKKIKNKRAEITLTSFLVGLLFVMGGFFATYYLISGNAESAGITIPDNYNQSFNTIDENLDDLETKINDMRDTAAEIKEEGISAQSAWNGMVGLGTALLLPLTTVNAAIEVAQAFFFPGSMTIIPSWVITLVILAITITVILLILGKLAGEQKT